MSSWNVIVTVLSLLLLVYLLIKESRRTDRRYLILRITLSCIAVASLAMLGYEKNRKSTNLLPETLPIALLTAGYNPDSVKDFQRENNAVLYTTEPSIENAVQITDVAYVKLIAGGSRPIHVFGWGLNRNQLSSLADTPIVTHLAPPPPGFKSVSWIQQLQPGERLRVQGSYHNTDTEPVKLLLGAFNTALDSVIIPAKTFTDIQLSTIPRHFGRAVYSVYSLKGDDTISTESIPVMIGEGSVPKILMLASSPDFDNKFLKTWLVDNGYEVVSKTLISKNKYSRDFFNSDVNIINGLGKDLLQNFDVVVTDQQSLLSLPGGELNMLEEKILSGGLGLVVKADSASRLFYAARFPIQHSGNQNAEQIRLHLGDSSNHLPPIAIQQAAFLQASSGSKPLLRDSHDRIFANSILYGKGTIVLSTLLNSYNWALAGQNEDYHSFWSFLLYYASKKKAMTETWNILPRFPIVNHLVSVNTETLSEQMPKAVMGGANVYLQQRHELPFSWEGKYWPSRSGWQAGIAMNGNAYYWYAYEKNDWISVRANENFNATMDYANLHKTKDKIGKESVAIRKVKIPGYLFFALFVLSCGALWIRIKGLGS